MDIREFRNVTDAALRDEGFSSQKLLGNKVWSLPGEDIIRLFQPHAYRRSWVFVYSGAIGIEIPALRSWINKYKPGEGGGILRGYFTAYIIANEDVLNKFMVEFGNPVPADLWAGLLRDRVARIPSSLEMLLSTYRTNREELGWLAHPHTKPAWDFVQRWRANPDPSLHVPRMSPTGQIV